MVKWCNRRTSEQGPELEKVTQEDQVQRHLKQRLQRKRRIILKNLQNIFSFA